MPRTPPGAPPLDPVGGSAPKQFAKVVARRRQSGFLQLPCSLGFRLAFSATGGARLPQFAKVVARRRQGGILQLPCSLGFRLAFSATGGARLRPPSAFEKSGGKPAGKLLRFSGEICRPAAHGERRARFVCRNPRRKGVADDSFGRQKTATARGGGGVWRPGGPRAPGPAKQKSRGRRQSLRPCFSGRFAPRRRPRAPQRLPPPPRRRTSSGPMAVAHGKQGDGTDPGVLSPNAKRQQKRRRSNRPPRSFAFNTAP